MATLQLYHYPRTRADRPHWLLEELEVPYELVRVDIGASRADIEYIKTHPHGEVPALRDGDIVVFESAAICAYLADRFPEKSLAPKFGDPLRARYYQWLFYVTASLEYPAFEVLKQRKLLPEDKRSPALLNAATHEVYERLQVLEKELNQHPYLLGDKLSAADVLLGSTLMWNRQLLPLYPKLDLYVQTLSNRAAFKRMIAQGRSPTPPEKANH